MRENWVENLGVGDVLEQVNLVLDLCHTQQVDVKTIFGDSFNVARNCRITLSFSDDVDVVPIS
jgi:hypothetical protein